MPGIVLTLPIMADKVEAWRRFCQEMSGSRLKLHDASRRRLGITRERLALVENSFGSTAVATLEAPNIEQALSRLISSVLPFDCWYREQMQKLHGIQLTRYEHFVQPASPPQNQELLFEWTHSPSATS